MCNNNMHGERIKKVSLKFNIMELEQTNYLHCNMMIHYLRDSLDCGFECKGNLTFWLLYIAYLNDKFGSPVTWDKLSFALRSIGTVTEQVPETLLLYIYTVCLFLCFCLFVLYWYCLFLLFSFTFLICILFCVVHRMFPLRLLDYNVLSL
jgi:hypothetical protein